MAINLEELKQKSILDVANSLGMELRKVGQNAYQWSEHDSLVITPEKNSFRWYSKDISGDVIELVQTIKSVSFKEAAYYLQNGTFSEYQEVEKIRKPFDYKMKKYENLSFKEGRAYLKNERQLSDETIDFFIEKGVLAQSTRLNKVIENDEVSGDFYKDPVLVFKSLDRDKKVVGASLVGLDKPEIYELSGTPIKRKQIAYNSDGMSGMNLSIGVPKRLVFAESPIDLMSYYELHKDELKDVQLVAMDGLKKATVSRYMADMLSEGRFSQERKPDEVSGFLDTLQKSTSYFQEHSDAITLAVDNDEAGLKFIKQFQDKKIPVQVDVPKLHNEQTKNDWNDELKFIKEKVKKNQMKTSWVVAWNERTEGLKNYSGQQVTPELLKEIQELDNTDFGGQYYYKFAFNQMKGDKIVDTFRANIGFGVEANEPLYQAIIKDFEEKEKFIYETKKAPELQEQNKKTNASLEDSSIEEPSIPTKETSKQTKKRDELSTKRLRARSARRLPLDIAYQKEEKMSKEEIKKAPELQEQNKKTNASLEDSSIKEPSNPTKETSRQTKKEMDHLVERSRPVLPVHLSLDESYQKGEKMSNYKLTTIDQRFIAETIARTGSEQLLEKAARNFVGLYDETENWYIPLRANLGKKKPEGAYLETPFETQNFHFKRPGLDFEKALYVPKEMVQEIRNTLPQEQAEFINRNQEKIKSQFESYIVNVENLSEDSPSFQFSTAPLFPEGIEKIKELSSQKLNETTEKEADKNMKQTQFESRLYDSVDDPEIMGYAETGETTKNNEAASKEITKNAEKAKIDEAIKAKDTTALNAIMAAGIAQYLDSDQYKNYLDAMSKIHNYSSHNIQMILAQKPDASVVTTLPNWNKNFDRHVTKGEKALWIMSPNKKGMTDKEGKPILDDNGKQKTYIKNFRLTPVYDISQTNGKEFPEPVKLLDGDVDKKTFLDLYEALHQVSEKNQVEIKFAEISNGSNGFYSHTDNSITLKKGLPPLQTIKTLIHEITHSELHKKDAEFAHLNASAKELQAESVAYVVSAHYGIDTSSYSFGYLANWSRDKEGLSDLKNELQTVQLEANDLIKRIDKNFEKIHDKSQPKNHFEEVVKAAQKERINKMNAREEIAKKDESSLEL